MWAILQRDITIRMIGGDEMRRESGYGTVRIGLRNYSCLRRMRLEEVGRGEEHMEWAGMSGRCQDKAGTKWKPHLRSKRQVTMLCRNNFKLRANLYHFYQYNISHINAFILYLCCLKSLNGSQESGGAMDHASNVNFGPPKRQKSQ